MIITEKIKKELLNLQNNIELVLTNNNVTDLQLENFLRTIEKSRFNILKEIKMYNKTVEFEYEKIKSIDDEYKAELIDNILKIYVPEVMPSYKNIKTHTYKRILLNIAEKTKQFEGLFADTKVIIFIKIFDNILGWDVDNKCVKAISDALILSKVIRDDNMTRMCYCVKGEFSENAHTEIYVTNAKNIDDFLLNYQI